jgi:hypothetical protein
MFWGVLEVEAYPESSSGGDGEAVLKVAHFNPFPSGEGGMAGSTHLTDEQVTAQPPPVAKGHS